ncbi:MAG: NAD(P)H-binding protein [Pseudomonadota bacterium]
MKTRWTLAALFAFLLGTPYSLASPPGEEAAKTLLIYGASGRIGQPIVSEAVDRGYRVTGVSRNADRLAQFADHIRIVESDILDPAASWLLLSQHDAVIVSVGGAPVDKVPENYIAPVAAAQLIDVLQTLGDQAPRLIFVGNLFTLEYADGKTLLEMGRVDVSNANYAMFYGHQLALDAFRASDVNWTVATPPNGLRLEGRTGDLVWGGDVLLRDADGRPAEISPEDFAFAVLEELEAENYVRQRFNVARRR